MSRAGEIAGDSLRAIVALIRRIDEAIGSAAIVALVKRIDDATGSGTPSWEKKSNALKPRVAAKARKPKTDPSSERGSNQPARAAKAA